MSKNAADMNADEFKKELDRVAPKLSNVTVSEHGLERGLSAPEAQRLLEASLTMLRHADLKEWQAYLLRAGAIWNIKTHKLHAAAGAPDLDTFANSLHVGERERQNYARIGQRMFEMSIAHAKERGEEIDPTSFAFNQKRIIEVFEGYFTNGHVVTVGLLSKASVSLEEFRGYLAGTFQGEGRIFRLLEANNVPSKKLEDVAHDRVTTTRDFHGHMRKIAKEKGLKWNKEKFCFENIDGAALRDDQRVELTTRESGLDVWRQSFKEIRLTKKRLASIATNLGESYALYDRVPDTNFHTIVTEIARSMRNEIESFEEMLECLLAKDFPRMEELAKVRADEEVNA